MKNLRIVFFLFLTFVSLSSFSTIASKSITPASNTMLSDPWTASKFLFYKNLADVHCKAFSQNLFAKILSTFFPQRQVNCNKKALYAEKWNSVNLEKIINFEKSKFLKPTINRAKIDVNNLKLS